MSAVAGRKSGAVSGVGGGSALREQEGGGAPPSSVFLSASPSQSFGVCGVCEQSGIWSQADWVLPNPGSAAY